jgi:hypothetical protein
MTRGGLIRLFVPSKDSSRQALISRAVRFGYGQSQLHGKGKKDTQRRLGYEGKECMMMT